jgi:xanthine dehydrogenase YagS FAD-binding subunit
MRTWKQFTHVDAKTVEEASAALLKGKAALKAGGTDLMGAMRFEILPTYPEVVINLRTIPGLDFIKEEAGVLKIGALTRLEDIAKNSVVKSKYAALAEAAHRTASPHIRDMGTIGGNICQLTRCWYFRTPDNRFYCVRKGGDLCPATAGDNRYHSIFGGLRGCPAVHPSDTAPALVALNAKIKTNKRVIEAEKFWDLAEVQVASTVLAAGEIVTEIQIPAPPAGAKSAFMKFALRKSIDFPIVNCAVLLAGGSARICLNAVGPKPYRAIAAEEAMQGKAVDEASAEAAGEAAVADAKPLPGNHNNWKIPIAKAMVKRTILACA